MPSGESSGGVGRAPFEEAFPRVGDALTLYLWRRPAFHLVRWATSVGLPAAAVTLLEAVVAALVFWLFWHGRYWPGLIVAVVGTLLRVVALMMSRLGHARGRANRVRIVVEIGVPLLWWWAWEHGLTSYGLPFHRVYATMVLSVVVGGTVAIHVMEALAVDRFKGMERHWRQP